MAKGYLIARATVTDPDQYKLYVEATSTALGKYNAKFLARGGAHKISEGIGRPRNVVIEFPSFADAIAYYESEEYQAARKHRENAGEVDIVIVEGV